MSKDSSPSKYKAGSLTIHMTPAQAELWNEGAIDSDGPDGESVKVSWNGLIHSMTLRDFNSLLDLVEDHGRSILMNSINSPAVLVASAKSFPISWNDAKILFDAQDQISDIIAKLYVDTGLFVEEVQLTGSPRPQAWLKVKKL